MSAELEVPEATVQALNSTILGLWDDVAVDEIARRIATPVVIAVLERWSADLMRDGFDAPARNMLAEIARLEGGAR